MKNELEDIEFEITKRNYIYGIVNTKQKELYAEKSSIEKQLTVFDNKKERNLLVAVVLVSAIVGYIVGIALLAANLILIQNAVFGMIASLAVAGSLSVFGVTLGAVAISSRRQNKKDKVNKANLTQRLTSVDNMIMTNAKHLSGLETEIFSLSVKRDYIANMADIQETEHLDTQTTEKTQVLAKILQ